MLAKRTGKKQVLVPKCAATEKANTSAPGNEQKDEEGDQPKGEREFDHEKAPELSSETKKQVSIDENVLFGWMKDERIPVDYREN